MRMQRICARHLAGHLEVGIHALPGEKSDQRIHSIPLFREQMVLALHRDRRHAKSLEQRGVTCAPVYWSERARGPTWP
jgi:DNA-binding transcriptional LysR family regulator